MARPQEITMGMNLLGIGKFIHGGANEDDRVLVWLADGINIVTSGSCTK